MEKYYVLVGKNGDIIWYKDSACTIRHRIGGPAVVRADGSEFWIENNKAHRIGGPSVTYADGSKEYWVDGKRHRVDGPAIEYANGNKFWYVDGNLHRDGAPAVELYTGGPNEWYLHGSRVTEAEFNARNKKTACVDKTITIDGVNYKLTKI